MARRIVSDEVIADEIIAKLRAENIYSNWTAFALSSENEEIENVTDYIIRYETETSEWLESLIPYMEKRLNNTLIDDVIKDFFGDEFYRENVVPF